MCQSIVLVVPILCFDSVKAMLFGMKSNALTAVFEALFC